MQILVGMSFFGGVGWRWEVWGECRLPPRPRDWGTIFPPNPLERGVGWRGTGRRGDWGCVSGGGSPLGVVLVSALRGCLLGRGEWEPL